MRAGALWESASDCRNTRAPVLVSIPRVFRSLKSMSTFSPGRGRKKAVQNFTTSDGLWMVGFVAALLIGIGLLWMFGILSFDSH